MESRRYTINKIFVTDGAHFYICCDDMLLTLEKERARIMCIANPCARGKEMINPGVYFLVVGFFLERSLRLNFCPFCSKKIEIHKTEPCITADYERLESHNIEQTEIEIYDALKKNLGDKL